MKKRKIVWMFLSLVLLVSCKQAEPATPTPPSSPETSQSKPEEKKTERTLYQGIVSNYQQALSTTDPNTLKSLGVNGLVISVKNYPHVYKGVAYTYSDLDQNGVEELIMAFELTDGSYMPIDYYTLNGETVVRLSQGSGQLDMIGERMILLPLADGKLLFRGSGGAASAGYSLYQFSSNGLALEKVSDRTSKEELTNADILDLTKLSWTQVEERSLPSSSSETKIKSSTPRMNLSAIQNGDFSSIVGTWKNGRGHTLVFGADNSITLNGHLQVYRGAIQGDEGAIDVGEEGYYGGFAMKFATPGMSMFEQIEDVSDSSKERIWAGQSYTDNPADFYYKVE